RSETAQQEHQVPSASHGSEADQTQPTREDARQVYPNVANIAYGVVPHDIGSPAATTNSTDIS
ncbi:hypothetical protein WJX84_010878, partial [Apatococcus fuscideae]